MAIKVHNIKTGMGRVSVNGAHPLYFLTEEQQKEFDEVGYSGRDLSGKKTNFEAYLNSLNIGEFRVSQTKRDGGDFSEAYTITRVIADEVELNENGITDAQQDSVNDISIRITNKLIKLGYVPDCNDSDDEDEFVVQDIIREEIIAELFGSKE